MNPYTVLLLYPDTLADTYGQDTYLAYVKADNVPKAIKEGQTQARKANGNACKGDDFFCLLVIEGHHTDVRWAR